MAEHYNIIINDLQRSYFIAKLSDDPALKAKLAHLPQVAPFHITIDEEQRLALKATVADEAANNAWLDAQNITDEFERQDILWMHDMLLTADESSDEDKNSALHPQPTVNGLCL
jgi:hypothetical protein